MFKLILEITKKIKPSSFSGLSMYDVAIFFWKGLTALSRIIAKSGNNPVHQKTKETDK